MNELRTKSLFDMDPFESAFRDFIKPWRHGAAERAPQIRIDLSESDESYMVKAEIPGVRKEDIDVRIDGNQVTISAEVKRESEEKKGERSLCTERSYGFASRSFLLSSDVDSSKSVAKYQDGVLQLQLPKKAESSARRLAIG